MSTSNAYRILEFYSFIHSLIQLSKESKLNAILGPVGDTGTYKIHLPSKSGDAITQAGKGEV